MPEIKISRLEVNIRRLLSKCEYMVNGGKMTDNWRLPKFIKTVEEMIKELECNNTKPEKDVIMKYKKRFQFLKGLMETQTMENTLEKSVAVQMLAPPSALDSNTVQEIYQRSLANVENDIRGELFQGSSELRQRSSYVEPSGSQELDFMLKYHNEKHEQISSDMLTMAQNMKEQSELAGKIIRDDTKVLEDSNKTMDNNYYNLDKHSNRLQVFISKSSWNCWTWIILAVIVIVFLNMIFFMKVTRKKY